jgi:FKBP-type peptidyl-prolyl cis-trans isomerase 2
MKEKKLTPRKGETAGWKKVLVVAVGVLFVVLMILSGMGTSWITGMKSAQPGDTALIDYTIRDSDGNVVITTSQAIFNTTLKSGDMAFLTARMSVGVNSTVATDLIKVPAYHPQVGQLQFGLFSPEIEAISQELTGMKKGEMRTVTFMTDPSFIRHMTVEEFEGIGGNYTEVRIGDPFLLAFVEKPVVNLDNTTNPDLYVSRIGYVTGKDPDGVNINFGYASAEITLDQLNTVSGTSS